MRYFRADIKNPLTFFSCGHFIADRPWIHMKRNLDSFEIIIGTQGTVFLQQDDERYEVTPQNALLLLPGHTHQGYAYSPANTSFYWIHFQCKNEWELPDEAEANQYVHSYRINPCFKNLAESVLVPLFMEVSNREKLTVQVRQLMHNASSGGYTNYSNDYMISLLLMELTQQHIETATVETPAKSDFRISAILEWLNIHLTDELSVAELADKFGYNKDYFTRYFKKHTGMSVVKYINAMRIMKAKELLNDSSLSVKEIAYSLGFKDEKYFMKYFKTHEQITPSKYRNTFYKVHLNNE